MSMKSLCTYGKCSTVVKVHCLHFQPRTQLCFPKLQLYKWRRYLETGSKRLAKETEVSKIHELKIGVDIVRSIEKDEMSLPILMYMYSPLKYFLTKLNLWKLKIQWDLNFVESEFIDNSKQAAVLITDMIRNNKTSSMELYTTPMGYKQISHDMLGSTKDYRVKLLRFRADHIRRAIPLKVNMMRHYGHKFAFIDMVFVCMRRANDFSSLYDVKEINQLIDYLNYRPANVDNRYSPIIFAEIFIRFRRDYSLNPDSAQVTAIEKNTPWLISNYKILQFDLINNHPFLDTKATTNSVDNIRDLNKE